MIFEGVVIKSTGNLYVVQRKDGSRIECNLKGNFRIKGIKTTNPVAVGDRVLFKLIPKQKTGLITDINDRANYIIRKATNLSKIAHIIAANIDQAFIIATLTNPRTSAGFIDRFIVTAEAYNIPVNIIFNKIDIYDDILKDSLNELITLYDKLGYKCFKVSALKGYNIETIKKVMKNKNNLFSGPSGVGKSTLINAIQPGLNIKTEEISYYHNKGKHITTFTEMHMLSFGGFIIDTPGIKEFGLIDFQKEEISLFFPEMKELIYNCQFNNCTHVHEPNCAVKEALNNGLISKSRYNSYLGMLRQEDF